MWVLQPKVGRLKLTGLDWHRGLLRGLLTQVSQSDWTGGTKKEIYKPSVLLKNKFKDK